MTLEPRCNFLMRVVILCTLSMIRGWADLMRISGIGYWGGVVVMARINESVAGVDWKPGTKECGGMRGTNTGRRPAGIRLDATHNTHSRTVTIESRAKGLEKCQCHSPW